MSPLSRGLVLAAHGSHLDSDINEGIRSVGRAIDALIQARASGASAADASFDEVAVCFHQGSPRFSEVLDSMTCHDVTIVPMMTSEGYYAREVLPRELRRNNRFAQVRSRITPVLGAHDGVGDMIVSRVAAALHREEIDMDDATVVLVGHGTRRHPSSREQTIATGRVVGSAGAWSRTVCAFIDDEPSVRSVLECCATGTVCVVPFLIGSGPHARGLPSELGFGSEPCDELPFIGRRAGRTFIVVASLLADPALPRLVLELAMG